MDITRVLSFITVTFLSLSASATSVQPCPRQENNPLTSLEVYNGTPAEMFSLAPDPKDQNNGTWGDLETVYRQARKITVACGYQNGLLLNVEINNPVTSCSSTDIHGLNITCQMAPRPRS
ncbi:STY0301 family protein [Serratia sp. AKBS12]|uniref:STY0301 family protein n=1 Tax=Serratia sp. AKBS12 TaxID=2974597 RepID=UPI0021664E03|nr:STY0301 family protein [Serratia sp. AKBS12]MCS3406727.1 hypothetical protein [Serratia sp. AKBS12]HEI8868010.1 hypothetical protein [Serratia odorifera]